VFFAKRGRCLGTRPKRRVEVKHGGRARNRKLLSRVEQGMRSGKIGVRLLTSGENYIGDVEKSEVGGCSKKGVGAETLSFPLCGKVRGQNGWPTEESWRVSKKGGDKGRSKRAL